MHYFVSRAVNKIYIYIFIYFHGTFNIMVHHIHYDRNFDFTCFLIYGQHPGLYYLTSHRLDIIRISNVQLMQHCTATCMFSHPHHLLVSAQISMVINCYIFSHGDNSL